MIMKASQDIFRAYDIRGVYGEELDVVSNNKKYRTEIFSNTLSNIFYSLSDIKEKSIFYVWQVL